MRFVFCSASLLPSEKRRKGKGLRKERKNGKTMRKTTNFYPGRSFFLVVERGGEEDIVGAWIKISPKRMFFRRRSTDPF